MRLRVIDIHPVLIQLAAIMVQPAADHVDLALEHYRGELVAGFRYGRAGVTPLALVSLILTQVEDPVLERIGFAILFDPTNKVQVLTDEGQPAAALLSRQERSRCKSALLNPTVQVDIVIPHLGDHVILIAVLETTGDPYLATVEDRIHMGDGAWQILYPGPAMVGRIENVADLTGSDPGSISSKDKHFDGGRFPLFNGHVG